MTARRPVLIAAIFALSALLSAGPATAASPQKIYKDLADNGRLDANYSRADITRALNLRQVVKTDRTLTTPPTRRTASAPTPPPKASAGRVPFTGLDVVLLLIGGGPLLLIGVGLRRRLALGEHAEMIGS